MENKQKSFKLNIRQKSILSYINNNGSSQVGTLATLLEVAGQTIRNDLDKMCKIGLIERVHGGAVTLNEAYYEQGHYNLGYSNRQKIQEKEKKLIASATANLIIENSSLFMNIGTTTELVAHAIKNTTGLMIVTNNINIANILKFSESIEVMIAGGLVRAEDGGIIGTDTVDFIEQFRLNYAVIGVSSIDSTGLLLDYDLREVRITKSIMKNARSVILVADSSKFTRKAPIVVASFDEIDYLITDKIPNEDIIECCKKQKVTLIVAKKSELAYVY